MSFLPRSLFECGLLNFLTSPSRFSNTTLHSSPPHFKQHTVQFTLWTQCSTCIYILSLGRRFYPKPLTHKNNLEFGVLLEDTLKRGQEELRINTPTHLERTQSEQIQWSMKQISISALIILKYKGYTVCLYTSVLLSKLQMLVLERIMVTQFPWSLTVNFHLLKKCSQGRKCHRQKFVLFEI